MSGVENLVDDDGADDEGYQNPQAEDKADGGGLNPVAAFPLNNFGLGVNIKRRRGVVG